MACSRVVDPVGKYWYTGFCARNIVSFCPSSMLSSVPDIVPARGEAIEVPYRHNLLEVSQIREGRHMPGPAGGIGLGYLNLGHL
jgi:hypothetical protein